MQLKYLFRNNLACDAELLTLWIHTLASVRYQRVKYDRLSILSGMRHEKLCRGHIEELIIPISRAQSIQINHRRLNKARFVR